MWTTADLISAVRRQTFMPDVADMVDSTRGQFTDAEILAFGDEELASGFVDQLRALRDESRVTYFDTAVSGARLRLGLPDRAMVRAVRRVHYVTVDGTEAQEITPIAPADAYQYSADTWLAYSRLCWYFEGDDLIFPFTPDDGSIRVYYQIALPSMALVSDCAQIQLFFNSLTATVDALPSWAAVDEIADVVRGSSPFPMLDVDLVITGTQVGPPARIELATWPNQADGIASDSLATRRQDYICRRYTTAYPPIPVEWHPALAAAIGVRVLESIGDVQAVGFARDLRDRRIDAAVRAATPRNLGRGERIVNRDSALRSPRRWWSR